MNISNSSLLAIPDVLFETSAVVNLDSTQSWSNPVPFNMSSLTDLKADTPIIHKVYRY